MKRKNPPNLSKLKSLLPKKSTFTNVKSKLEGSLQKNKSDALRAYKDSIDRSIVSVQGGIRAEVNLGKSENEILSSFTILDKLFAIEKEHYEEKKLNQRQVKELTAYQSQKRSEAEAFIHTAIAEKQEVDLHKETINKITETTQKNIEKETKAGKSNTQDSINSLKQSFEKEKAIYKEKKLNKEQIKELDFYQRQKLKEVEALAHKAPTTTTTAAIKPLPPIPSTQPSAKSVATQTIHATKPLPSVPSTQTRTPVTTEKSQTPIVGRKPLPAVPPIRPSQAAKNAAPALQKQRPTPPPRLPRKPVAENTEAEESRPSPRPSGKR